MQKEKEHIFYLLTILFVWRQKIDDMIERSEVKCRKDSLWQRMLIGGKVEEKDNVRFQEDWNLVSKEYSQI